MRQTTPLDPRNSAIVLLGLIGAEAVERCRSEHRRITTLFEERIAFHAKHFPDDVDAWRVRQRLWRPVTTVVEYTPTSQGAFIAAPTVTMLARVDLGETRFVRFSLCERGLVRIETANWPAEIQRPVLAKEPSTVTEAVEWARRIVARAMPPLLAFVDPMRA